MRVGEHICDTHHYLAGSDGDRAADLMAAFALDAESKDVRRALAALKAARQRERGRAAESAAAMARGFGQLNTDGR